MWKMYNLTNSKTENILIQWLVSPAILLLIQKGKMKSPEYNSPEWNDRGTGGSDRQQERKPKDRHDQGEKDKTTGKK